MKKFAVILGGCGTMDGSEIHESTLTLLAIKKSGADYQIFAPDKDQHYVWNHYKANEMPEKRNMLVEAARIARGEIKELGEYKPENFDALVIPGGNGIAKNLCNFAFKGAACEVYPPLAEALRKTAALKKPIGAMCIAPVILGKVFGKVVITLGGESGSLDEALKVKYPGEWMKDAVESKLFGIGVESMTVGSHDFYLGYAIKNIHFPSIV